MLDPHALASLGFRFSPMFRALLGILGYDPEPALPEPTSGGVSAPMRIRRRNSLFKPIKPIQLPLSTQFSNRKEEEFFFVVM